MSYTDKSPQIENGELILMQLLCVTAESSMMHDRVWTLLPWRSGLWCTDWPRSIASVKKGMRVLELQRSGGDCHYRSRMCKHSALNWSTNSTLNWHS